VGVQRAGFTALFIVSNNPGAFDNILNLCEIIQSSGILTLCSAETGAECDVPFL
jgi:hypothetical protein